MSETLKCKITNLLYLVQMLEKRKIPDHDIDDIGTLKHVSTLHAGIFLIKRKSHKKFLIGFFCFWP